MSILNRDLLFLLDCAAILGFPFADHLLRSLPVAEFQRLTHLFPAECSVNPNGALAVAVFPPLRALLAVFAMTAIDGQHCGRLLTDAGLR
ncbi:MAG TPA: hypothetical protein VKQ28_14455 [Candidatus Acidoferrum sp.]|nr:hypothetical protein [Candidatus Acidoferrum sp.]